jgi:hypothetical protein
VERFRKVFEGTIEFDHDDGLMIGDTRIGNLVEHSHSGKRFRILVEEIPATAEGSTIGETEAEVSYEADFLEHRSAGPHWRTGAISALDYKGALDGARQYRDGHVIGIRIREIGTTTTVVYEEHIDGRRFGE